MTIPNILLSGTSFPLRAFPVRDISRNSSPRAPRAGPFPARLDIFPREIPERNIFREHSFLVPSPCGTSPLVCKFLPERLGLESWSCHRPPTAPHSPVARSALHARCRDLPNEGSIVPMRPRAASLRARGETSYIDKYRSEHLVPYNSSGNYM